MTDRPEGHPGDDQPGGEPQPAPQQPEPEASPSQATPGGGSQQGTSMGLDANIAALLAYLVGFISGLVIYLVEKENTEVRFHAAQSVIVFGALFVVSVVLQVIPVLGTILGLLLWLASVGLWIYLMIQGYQLNHTKLPIAGDLAEEWAGKQVA